MKFKTKLFALLLLSYGALAQQPPAQSPQPKKQGSTSNPSQKIVVITGARFSYKLIEKWIDEYNKVEPSVQLVVEARGSNDPLKYDVLAEVYEQPEDIKATREYIYVARYAVFPVATSASSFAKVYGKEGLTKQHIVQIFFDDLFADKEKQKTITAPFTVYTRLQKAGVPVIFSRYFGFEQKDIKGNAIAGADTHLIKALLKDSTAVSYLPTAVIYPTGNEPTAGLTAIPVDLNGNNKIGEEEKIVNSFKSVITKLEPEGGSGVKNVPVGYLHLSVDKNTASPEAVAFLKWVNENGQQHLHEFGFFAPESRKYDKSTFNAFASQRQQ